MRIRSIKPEFWTSPDVMSLDYFTRLLFIGLWTYVDDNGVGYDLPGVIAASLFPADLARDSHETLMKVSSGLQTLHQKGCIERYDANGRAYLHITKWDEHQKIQHPAKARKPAPDDPSSHPRESLTKVSRDSHENFTPDQGTGNKGTREIVVTSQPSGTSATAKLGEQVKTTLRIVNAWKDQLTPVETPQSEYIREVTAQIQALVNQGYEEDRIRGGLAEWWAGKYPPKTLPNYVVRAVPKESTATQRARRGMEIAKLYELQEQEQ